jgi:hypothetical protein
MRAATESSNQLRSIIAEISVSCISHDEQSPDGTSLSVAVPRNARNSKINYSNERLLPSVLFCIIRHFQLVECAEANVLYAKYWRPIDDRHDYGSPD